MRSKSEKSEWQRLSWAEKVQFCQQRISQEDSLLIAYVVIFIGLEAIFATVVLSRILPLTLDVIIAVLGMLVAINYMLVCKRRGDRIDTLGAIFYKLWSQVPSDETIASIELNKNSTLLVKAKDIGEDYEGCILRLMLGWRAIISGWPPCRKRLKYFFQSGRRLTIFFTPVLVIIIWAFILCQRLDP